MSGFEAAFVTATATAVVAPLVNRGLEELKSRVKKHTLAVLYKELNKELAWLLASQIDKDIEASSGKQKDTNHVYRHWTARVSNIKAQVECLSEKYEKVRKKKLKFLLTWIKRNLRKKMEKAWKEVIELRKNSPEKILVDGELLERVIKEAGVKSIVEYPTLREALKCIQDLLKKEQVKCVALHGQRGVGKTTIMKHLNNNHHFSNKKAADEQADKKADEFDMVIFIQVAADEQADKKADERTESLHILQKIADRLKTGREGDESEVAGRIQGVLEDKKYLLILDGIRHKPNRIWEMLDISNDIKDSKVVITTHYPLAHRTKCVDREVKLQPLNNQEALNMFRNIVGVNVLSPNAVRVCERFCCRLPLLIFHIASSFDKEDPYDWQKALNELTPWPKVGVEGLKQLYQHLKISYDLLSLSKRKCFLYASLYPANSDIYTHYLEEYCIVQRFLSDVEADIGYNELRTRVSSTILRHLLNISFLEEVEQMRYVKMNYFYWQLASYILSEDSNLEGRTYVDNEKHEEERRIQQDSRQHAKWFSWIGSKSNDLPTNPNCGSLEALLLQRKMNFGEFPKNYFRSMGNLLVLNLYCTKISKLPPLKGLTNLKAFYLNGCSELQIVPHEIEPLKHLEVFDIRNTEVNFVPRSKSLRCLRLSYIESDSYHLISILPKLEELTIEVKSLQNAELIIDQVASLKKLSTLRCAFNSPEIQELTEDIESWIGEKTRSLPFEFLYDVKTQKI